MNKLLILLVFIIGFHSLTAQFIGDEGETLYGNEWINYDQKYYKIPIAEDGMYKITIDQLVSAGIPIDQINGRNFQVFHNGEAYPIYVSERNQLSGDDYIEFYGQKNRGELDRIFYEDPETMQLNPEYSLFTDTSAYFLTWNDEGDNLRMKDVDTDLSNNFLPVEKFYMHKERLVRSESLQKPTRGGAANVRYSHFDIGEGFAATRTTRREVTIGADHIYENGPDPSAEIRFTTNGTAHIIKFTVNDAELQTFVHNGVRMRQEKESFDLSILQASNKIKLEGTVDQFDYNYVSVVDLNYPRSFDFNNEDYFEFFIEQSFFEKYVEIENFDGGDNPIIYDPVANERIIPVQEDGKLKFIVPGANRDRSLVVYNSEEGVSQASVAGEVEFINYGALDQEYIIISHPQLRDGAVDQVQAYADYRASSQGGGFKTLIVNVEELYEQFSYGIERHSYSVKNFVNYVKETWTDPKYVFILGKGREYSVYRKESQIEDPIHRSYYVPTFGVPGSDNLMVSKGSQSTSPQIPTGRLAAKDADDIEKYLTKVKEHESFDSKAQTIEEKLWKKRIMHLAGAETTLQESIGNYLESMEVEIEDSQYGADVTTFKKSSTETIQEADADELLNTIDAGLSILTFFGHSSVGTFDFNIDDVNKLKNFGKYPLVISLGCFSGNVHTQSYGISEQYVLTGEKGAIAFMASSSTAYVSPQGNFGIDLYTKMGNEFYGKSIGEAFSSSLTEKANLTALAATILNEQMTLHGDPAIKLATAEGPDYVFDYSSFTTDPSIVESNTGTFDISFKVANLGKFQKDSLAINLQHIKSDGSLGGEKDFKINAPKFDTTLVVQFANGDNSNVGKNLILGELDNGNRINEIPAPNAEDNNTIVDASGEDGFSFFTINNSAIPVSPCDFGIYNEQEVVLRASTYNAISNQETKYVFELDTSGYFDSPSKQRYEIVSIGGLLEWTPEYSFEQGKSYYWRISPDSINAEIGYKWEDASFVYLPNSSNGWNQSHYYQYLDNDFDGIYIDNETRNFEFDTAGFFIKIFNSVWDPNIIGYQFNFDTYATSIRPWNFMQEGVAVVVGDQFTGGAWKNAGGEYGSINTTNFGSFRCFAYPTDTPANRADLINLIENVAPDGSFIFFFTVIKNFNSDFHPANWINDEESGGRSIYNALEDEGAILSRQMIESGTVPYTFVYQKGVGKITEEVGETKDELITSTAFIPVRSSSGEVVSSEIGPAKEWDKLLLAISSDGGLDTILVDIIGIKEDGQEKLLSTTTLQSEIDLKFIDANEYSKIRLGMRAEDEQEYTPGQLGFWRVLYESYPDLSINTSSDFVFNKDTLQQGEELQLSIRLDNISQYAVDTVNVSVVLTDEQNQTIEKIEDVYFASSDQYLFNYTYNTRDLLGKYSLSINVNGDNKFTEKTIVNNFGVREFVVIKDIRNPILDVTFDGNKILDGDIVSPTPLINISLKDENEFLLLDDPSIIELALIYPDNSEVFFTTDDEQLTFFPASDPNNNEAYFELNPSLTQDGLYTIKILASDVSNNIAGDINLERSFEVINEQLISNVLNYPNPFSNSTEFIFTLTGSEIPDELKIEIMTVNGKVVKEIFREELGELKIGVNRTSYKWDGSDDYGNKLANGVYLYRVIAKHQSELVSNFEIGETNDYFKNSLGKLVILR